MHLPPQAGISSLLQIISTSQALGTIVRSLTIAACDSSDFSWAFAQPLLASMGYAAQPRARVDPSLPVRAAELEQKELG